MKVVLDIETVQAPRDEWVRLVGKPSIRNESSLEEEKYDLLRQARLKSNVV